LVVNRIERDQKVVTRALIEAARIADLEADVAETLGRGIRLRVTDRIGAQVVPGEATARVAPRHRDQRLAAPAAGVEHVDAGLQPSGQSRRQREQLGEELRDDGLVAVVRHHAMEVGVVV
jgi:hypothetical protein